MGRHRYLSILLVFALFANHPASAAPDSHEGVTDQIMVKFKGGASVGAVDARRHTEILREHEKGLEYFRVMSEGFHVLKLPERRSISQVKALADALTRNPEVDEAVPDLMATPDMTPNDVYYPQQWHYHNGVGGIDLEPAWDKANGGAVVVAIVDTGYTNHTDLLPGAQTESGYTLVQGYDFIANLYTANDGNGRDADPHDPGDWRTGVNSSWHGTHVQGTIGARTNNSFGVSGVAWNARILPVRVLGKEGGYASDIVDGIKWSAGLSVPGVPTNSHPAKVINLSLGSNDPYSCPSAMQSAITAARNAGATIVVAAGNKSADAASYWPANCLDTIVVASVTSSGVKSSFSNSGAAVDLAAPGSSVYSTHNLGTTVPSTPSYAYMSGTSMAAPHVSGIAALLYSIKPTITPAEVESIIKNTARPFGGACGGCGTGIADAQAAVSAVKNPVPGYTTVSYGDLYGDQWNEIEWTAVPGATNYEIWEYWANAGGGYEGTVRRAVVTGLSFNAQIDWSWDKYVWVRACNAVGCGAPSNHLFFAAWD